MYEYRALQLIFKFFFQAFNTKFRMSYISYLAHAIVFWNNYPSLLIYMFCLDWWDKGWSNYQKSWMFVFESFINAFFFSRNFFTRLSVFKKCFLEAVIQRCSVKKDVLKNYTKFIGKHLCQSLSFDKVADLRPTSFQVNLPFS